jgi:ankyrin repeat protein
VIKHAFRAALRKTGFYPPKSVYSALRHCLCTDGQEEKLKAILKEYPDAVRWEKPGDMSPLAYAYWQKQFGACDILVAHDPTILEDRNGAGVTLLQKEAMNLSVGGVAYMLALGADLHAKDGKGNTALHRCAGSDLGNDVVDLLLQRGANATEKNAEGLTPLQIAAMHGSERNFKMIEAYDSDLSQKDHEGRTLLMRAALGGKHAIIKHLIATGAVLEEKSPRGMTALDYALSAYEHSAAMTLIENGAHFSPDNPHLLDAMEDFRQSGDAGFDMLIEEKQEEARIATEEALAKAELERQARERQAVEETVNSLISGTATAVTVSRLKLKR